jgi:hypothetical protein
VSLLLIYPLFQTLALRQTQDLYGNTWESLSLMYCLQHALVSGYRTYATTTRALLAYSSYVLNVFSALNFAKYFPIEEERLRHSSQPVALSQQRTGMSTLIVHSLASQCAGGRSRPRRLEFSAANFGTHLRDRTLVGCATLSTSTSVQRVPPLRDHRAHGTL